MGCMLFKVLFGCWLEIRLQGSRKVSEGLILEFQEGDYVVLDQSYSRGSGKSILKVELVRFVDGWSIKYYRLEKDRRELLVELGVWFGIESQNCLLDIKGEMFSRKLEILV